MARKKNMEAEDDSDYDDFDYGEEPDFNDPDDFVDDITDEELMPEVMRQKPKETDGVESVIVVDGVPIVGGDRVDKLKNVIRKIYGKFGKLVNEHYPSEENGNTKGYIFLEVRYRDKNMDLKNVSSFSSATTLTPWRLSKAPTTTSLTSSTRSS